MLYFKRSRTLPNSLVLRSLLFYSYPIFTLDRGNMKLIFSFVWTLPNSIERLFLLMSNTGIVFDRNWWMATAQELVGVSKQATRSLMDNVMSSNRVAVTELRSGVILCLLELEKTETMSLCCWQHFNSEYYISPSSIVSFGSWKIIFGIKILWKENIAISYFTYTLLKIVNLLISFLT